MILEFSVENTFSIKDRQTISFEAADDTDDGHIIKAGNKRLLKIAAIYGANASGKTNLIKAFYFYMWFILDSFKELKPQKKIPFDPFLFSEISEQSSSFFEIIFYAENIWYKYQIILTREKVLKEYLAAIDNDEEKTIYCFDTPANKYEYPKDGEELARFVRPNATFLSTAVQFNHTQMEGIYLYLSNRFIITGHTNDILFSYTVDSIEHDASRRQSVIKLLQKADIGNISGIAINKPNVLQLSHLYNNQEYRLPIWNESLGTQQIFRLAGPLMSAIDTNGFLVIDEIESSLHDDMLEFFITTFLENTKQSQLLFTTHNQNLLDSDLLRNDEVWFTQKNNDGGSDFFSLAEFKDVPENVSRRDLYKAGAFGALPHISRFFKE